MEILQERILKGLICYQCYSAIKNPNGKRQLCERCKKRKTKGYGRWGKW